MAPHKIVAVLILLMLVAGYAHAIGVGGEGLRFGRVGATAGKAIPAPPLVSCPSTGIFDFSNVCNDIYLLTGSL